jgi:hypothetical protein
MDTDSILLEKLTHVVITVLVSFSHFSSHHAGHVGVALVSVVLLILGWSTFYIGVRMTRVWCGMGACGFL